MDAIKTIRQLGFPWVTDDPFLFCAHHRDAYPAGDERLAPVASLAGRDLGQDFSGKDGWSMYHGGVVPGFPQHPHRGFETITIVRSGLVDHADSLGAAARFGAGDVQWMTAGSGIVHSEMFPLLRRDAANPTELFQIWLNLPAADKLAGAHFTMMWADTIPRRSFVDDAGRATDVTIVAGALDGARAPAAPPRSWAARPDSDVAIWTVRMAPDARWTLPPAADARSARTLYFFAGAALTVDGRRLDAHAAITLRGDQAIALAAGHDGAELVLLQGRPIAEPVVQYGPFVMNTRLEIQRAFEDYERTRFGGWPWPADDPNHGPGATRFARHADGRLEQR